jgi:hypothetical protein
LTPVVTFWSRVVEAGTCAIDVHIRIVTICDTIIETIRPISGYIAVVVLEVYAIVSNSPGSFLCFGKG